MAGIGDVTGSVAVGKDADLIVTAANPLDDLKALRHVETVMACGRLYRTPHIKINRVVETELDKFLPD